MSTISSRTRQLKRGSTSMTKDADKGKEVHSAAGLKHIHSASKRPAVTYLIYFGIQKI